MLLIIDFMYTQLSSSMLHKNEDTGRISAYEIGIVG